MAALGSVVLTGCFASFDNLGDTDGGSGAGGSGATVTTGEAGAPVCAQRCVLGKPAWFDGVSLFEIGAKGDVQHHHCPEFAPHPGSVGYAELTVEGHACPACGCSTPACILPTEMHASSAKCSESGPATVLDAPDEWEGCSADNPIAADVGCGGVPCLSLTVDAPVLVPCHPVESGAAPPPAWSWGTMARECMIDLSAEGCGAGELCAPVLSDGLRLCAFRYGDDEAFPCPDEEYTERMVVHAGVTDTRSCSPCQCGAPDGECSALVSVFADSTCGGLLAAVTVTSAMDAACVDVPPGDALESKEATLTVDNPGACAPSGGEPSGEVLPAGPVTLCCQKLEPEDPPK